MPKICSYALTMNSVFSRSLTGLDFCGVDVVEVKDGAPVVDVAGVVEVEDGALVVDVAGVVEVVEVEEGAEVVEVVEADGVEAEVVDVCSLRALDASSKASSFLELLENSPDM